MEPGGSALCRWAGLGGALLWAEVERVWAHEMDPGEMLVSAGGACRCWVLTRGACYLGWPFSDQLTPCGDTCDESELTWGFAGTTRLAFPTLVTCWCRTFVSGEVGLPH